MIRQVRELLYLLLPAAWLAFAPAAHAVDLRFTTDKGALDLASLRGKVVYLDYWASWCVPCRQSFPWMNEMQKRYGDKGFTVVAVSVDQDRAEAKRFLEQHPAAFTVAYDPQGETAKAMALKGMPSSFLIDRDGKIVASHVGFRESGKDGVEGEIRALIAH